MGRRLMLDGLSACRRLATTFSKILEMKQACLIQACHFSISFCCFRRRSFLSIVSIEMLVMVMSVMRFVSMHMSRTFFSRLVGIRSKSHDFDDEPKITFLISYSVARSKH